MNLSRPLFIAGLWCLVTINAAAVSAEEGRIDYLKNIKPLLKSRCYSCHGALKQESDLRLDTLNLMMHGGSSGAVIVPKDSAKSLLLKRINTGDADTRMPPESEGEPFSSEQVKLIRDWIDQGAIGSGDERPETDPKDHWSFKAVRRPEVPSVPNSGWGRNSIDAFLLQRYVEQGLVPQPIAPREVLIRRLYLDLVGLPPSEGELALIEKDQSTEWYNNTVERLLDDPRYGERWGRHWMDIWRYSDWWGLGEQLRSSQKHMWHWRDWIIESLNSNIPFDEMLRQMLAADELYPDDPQKLRATGYLARTFFLFNRHQWLDDTVEHFSKGFLGLTTNCAKCHDHKYDPIKQEDYYKIRAIFEPYQVRLDMVPGEADVEKNGIPRVFDGLPDRPTYRFIRGAETSPDKSKTIAPGIPDFFAFQELEIAPINLPSQAWQPERHSWVLDAHLAKSQKNLEGGAAAVVAAQAKLTSNQQRVSELSALINVENTAAESASPDVSAVAKKSHDENTKKLAEAQAAVVAAQTELTTAELTVTILKAELNSVRQRAAAMQATWNKEAAHDVSENAALEQAERVANQEAVKAEREVLVAKSQKTVGLAELKVKVAAAEAKEAAEKELATAREALEKATKALAEPGETYVKLRGAVWTPTRMIVSTGDDPDVPFPPQSTGRRTALSKWLTDRRNPLTARVAINHIWSRHLGAPLVPTLFDYGRKGATPAHPELVDWLAAEFIDSGWDMKHLHRLILNSAAYQMTSSLAGGEASASIDPDNHYFWHRVPIRLEAEVVRDSLLSLAGNLDLKMGGPSVPTAEQAESKRRSMYFFHSNNERNLLLTTFDEASVNECYQREQSIVPQQALALANSQQILDASPQIAASLLESSKDDIDFVRKSFLMVLGMRATDEEVNASMQALKLWKEIPELTTKIQGQDPSRTFLIWTLLNHNDFVTLR